ncbi:MAG: hypothetical protein EHM36_13095, partial [Deltaproteobacteria bacterium]
MTRERQIVRIRTLLSFLLVLSLLAGYGTITAKPAQAYGRPVHQDIARYARELANHTLDPNVTPEVPWWMEEINNYGVDIDNGAMNEDEIDHVWNHEGWCVTITHFWDPDEGPNEPMGSVFCNGPNAWQKAFILWGMALGQYHMGNKGAAYEYLGHVAHLVGDVTVPAHAHFDSHVYPDEYDDNYSNGDGFDYLPQALTDAERESIQNLGMIEIPDPAITPGGVTLLPLYWLLYTTAQVGDHYPSDDIVGDSDDPLSLVDFSLLQDVPEGVGPAELDGCDYTDVDSPCAIALATIRSNSYFYGIRAVAALYKLFAETARRQAELTVVIDSLTTLELEG